MVRISPNYPIAARTSGIEGWVCVVFTVTADGRVRDAEVTSSSPEGYGFEHAALRAVREWRYQRAEADTPGVQAILQFERPPPPEVYLGAFTISAANLEPFLLKDCEPVAPTDAEEMLNSTLAEVESELGMSCQEQADNLYACLDQEHTTIARVRIWNSLAHCRQYPSNFANDAKTLLNRR
jgi:TonB family protein